MLDYQPGPAFAEWHLWFNRYDFDLKLLSFGTFFTDPRFPLRIIDKKWNEDDDRSDDVSKTTDRSKSDSMKWRNDCNCDWLLQEPIKFEESVENFWLKKNVAPIFFRRSPDPEKMSPEILEPESLVHFRDGASQLARVRTRLRTTTFRDYSILAEPFRC